MGQKCWWRGRSLQGSWMENYRATWWSTAHPPHSRSVWDASSNWDWWKNWSRLKKISSQLDTESPSFLLLTVCCGHWIGHRAVNQSVCPLVQCVFSSVCLYRGGARTLDPHTDADAYCSRWVTTSVKIINENMKNDILYQGLNLEIDYLRFIQSIICLRNLQNCCFIAHKNCHFVSNI